MLLRRWSAWRGSTFIGSSLRAPKAAVSLCARGRGYVETLSRLDLRSGHSTSVRYGIDGVARAHRLPRTEELLVAGGWIHIHGNDPDTDRGAHDPRAARRLDLLLAGAADGRRASLLGIYGGVESADLRARRRRPAAPVRHAVHPAVGLRAERHTTGSLRAVTGS